MRGTVLSVMRDGGVWQRISLAAPEIFPPSNISCAANLSVDWNGGGVSDIMEKNLRDSFQLSSVSAV
eukprot:1763106-Ditylum_brightwellii.AAC.1